MERYAALLRGVSPMNCKMAELKACFESAGFTDVKTVLASGNVVFSARRVPTATLERKIEAAMRKELGRVFMTMVRSVDELRALIERDPYRGRRLPVAAKRVVTFLRRAPADGLELPVEQEGARILAYDGREAFSAYEPGPRGPVFMTLIERTFGRDVTTRTWDTVKKLAR
jgi:uncharacterized protein (DUF1697 family)